MVNTEIRMIIFFAAKDGEALYSQQKQDQELTVYQIRWDQISSSVVSDSLQPHESQHARPPCPSPIPGVHWDSHPSGQWCHPVISSSVVPFSSCPQTLQASESFPMTQLFTWGGQSTGVSASASVLLMNIQDWSPLRSTGWISLQCKGLRSLLQHHSWKASIFQCSAFLYSNSHIHAWLLEKP